VEEVVAGEDHKDVLMHHKTAHSGLECKYFLIFGDEEE
jgi:hypothetical protein